MCIALIAFKVSSAFPVIFLHNRDEFVSRTFANMNWQNDKSALYGVDEKDGGTWLGISKKGYFAAVTNVRGVQQPEGQHESRGYLVNKLIAENPKPERLADFLVSMNRVFRPFNIIYGNHEQIFTYNSVEEMSHELASGFHGISNATLNTPWPKVIRGKRLLQSAIESLEAQKIQDPGEMFKVFFDLLRDSWRPGESDLPTTGLTKEKELLLSSIFIDDSQYSSLLSTVLIYQQKPSEIYGFEMDHLKQQTGIFSFVPEESNSI